MLKILLVYFTQISNFILMKSESWRAKLLKFKNKIPRGLLIFIKKLSKLYQPQKSPKLLF